MKLSARRGYRTVWVSANLPEKVSRDMGYRSDSIAISRDMGPLSTHRVSVCNQFGYYGITKRIPPEDSLCNVAATGVSPITRKGTPDPTNSLCLGPLFPSNYRKKVYIKNFEGGGSWGPQNYSC